MAKGAGLAQKFWLHGRDISSEVGQLNRVATPKTFMLATGIDKSAVERLITRTDGVIDFSSFFDDATGKAFTALKSLLTTDVIALYANGTSVGNTCAFLEGKQNNYDGARDADGRMEFQTIVEATGQPVNWGVMLSAGEDTHASSTSSASKDDSASSSNGLRAVLQLREIDSGTPTFVIEDSANDSTWATLISFAAVADGSEPTAERKTVTGTVDRYLRVTTTGTFTNADFAIGYERGTANDIEDLS